MIEEEFFHETLEARITQLEEKQRIHDLIDRLHADLKAGVELWSLGGPWDACIPADAFKGVADLVRGPKHLAGVLEVIQKRHQDNFDSYSKRWKYREENTHYFEATGSEA